MSGDTSMRKKRETYRKKSENAIYTDIREKLKTAIALEHMGKKSEADDVVNGIKEKIESLIKEEENIKNVEQIRQFDRSVFPKFGELLAENGRVRLCAIREEEKNEYLAVSYEYSHTKNAFRDEKFIEELWNDFISEETFVCSIFDQATGKYVGYCSIKDLSKSDWELAVELKQEWCHKGYGAEAVFLFLKSLAALTGNRFFRVRVEIDNYASQSLMKKLGAYPNGVSEFLIRGKDLEKFRKENINMIDDKIRGVADEFGMDPMDILGCVLEYRLDMGSLKDRIIELSF